MIGKILYRFVVGFVLVFLMLPILFVVISSFGESSAMSFPPRSFTLDWYKSIPDPFIRSLKVSLIVATATSVFATVTGCLAALAIARGTFLGKQALATFSMAPLMVPTLVTAVALFQFSGLFWDWTSIELTGSLLGLIIGHSACAIPYVIRSVIAAHSHFDFSLEEAALSLGAGRVRTLLEITLPVLMPGIMSGALFAFLISLDDLPIALFMSGGDATTTLPVKIYTSIEYSLKPDVMAISAIIVYASLALVLAVERIYGLEKLFGGKAR